jgi:hypothetical protein
VIAAAKAAAPEPMTARSYPIETNLSYIRNSEYQVLTITFA